jgi:hypothetical protein
MLTAYNDIYIRWVAVGQTEFADGPWVELAHLIAPHAVERTITFGDSIPMPITMLESLGKTVLNLGG